MPKYTAEFRLLVARLLSNNNKYPALNTALVAQWILETGRGVSELAKQHNNYAGLKWRSEMKGYAEKVLIKVPSESEAIYFCSFTNEESFIKGYWVFLGRKPYKGWEKYAHDAYEYISSIGETWAPNQNYVERVSDLFAEADILLKEISKLDLADMQDGADMHCCSGMDDDSEIFSALFQSAKKPEVVVDKAAYSRNRNGTKIDTIVMHYTTSRELSGTVEWFKNPNREILTAAHYVIGRDGKIVQMVDDADACIHANSQNSRSIGIEHSARLGDAFTADQEKSSIALVRWLMQEYGIKPERVIGHKCAPRNTNCPGDLFSNYGATANSSCAEVTSAIQKWVSTKVFSADSPVG